MPPTARGVGRAAHGALVMNFWCWYVGLRQQEGACGACGLRSAGACTRMRLPFHPLACRPSRANFHGWLQLFNAVHSRIWVGLGLGGEGRRGARALRWRCFQNLVLPACLLEQ
jgi:hypothetical protein